MRKLHLVIAFSIGLAAAGALAPAAAQSLDEQWRRCINQGWQVDLDTAIAGCTAVIGSGVRAGADLAQAYYNRGGNYLHREDADRAIADYSDAIRLNPGHAGAFGNRGVAWRFKSITAGRARDMPLALSFVERARADFSEAIRLAPGNSKNWSNRGYANLLLGQLDQAMTDSTEAIRLDPADGDALVTRCQLRLRGRENSGAWADCNATLRVQPSNVYALYGRGTAAVRLGRAAEGATDISRARAASSGIDAHFRSQGIEP